jgi:hypothetical protein
MWNLQSPDRLAASTSITERFYVADDWVSSNLALPAAKEALKRPVLAFLTISFIYQLERECSSGTEQTRDRHSAPESHDRAQR